MVKKHGKGFFDDIGNFAGNVADTFDLFGTQAAQKKAEEAAKEAERLKNRHWSEKGYDLLGDMASAAIPHLTKAIFGGAKGDQRRFMANRAVPNRVPNSVRIREMRDVKDYNMNQQRKVFENEKRQVGSESESIKPIDSKDAGAAFKLQTYISKLQQILGQKADLFSQLQASPFSDLNQLKGTTKQAGLLTMMTSKAELLQAYNEMVSYVSLFFKDIQLDNRVRDRMYATFFQPLIDQMRSLAQQYPSLFDSLPPPDRAGARQPPTRTGKVYDLVRKELQDMYSLLMVAADNIQDGIFRPIGPKDVAEYSRDNDTNATFAKNPPPPAPAMPSMAVQQAQQQIQLEQQLQESNARAAQARAAEVAEQDPYNPAGDPSLDPATAAAYSKIQAQLRANGLPPDTTFPVMTIDELDAAVNAGTMSMERARSFFQQSLGLAIIFGRVTQEQLNSMNEEQVTSVANGVLPQVQLYNDWVTSRGVLAPPAPAPSRRPVRPPAEPSRRPEPERPRELQVATEDDLDTAVREFVTSVNFPASKRIPTQDSGGGEFGGERWQPLTSIENILRENNLRAQSRSKIKAAIGRYNAARPEKEKPGRKPKQPGSPAQQQQEQQQQEQQQEPGGAVRRPGEQGAEGRGMSGGRSYYTREGRELDFVPAPAINSAAPPFQFGYGSHHRPKFAWELEQEAAGPCYVRQDRVPYVVQGGLGMVNPDSEIGTFQVLRMAGEVGHRMSGGVYLPKEYVVQPAGEKERFGYGVDGDDDMFGSLGGYGSLKRRLAGGMVNPFAVSKDYHYKPVADGYDDAEDFAYGAHEEPVEATQQAHEEEEEKPVDLDENPNPFRVRNENYKVNTGKLKKVTYKVYDK